MLAQQTNVAALAQARLLAQFANKPLLSGLVAAHAARYQGLENALWSVLVGANYPAAVGDALSRNGLAVGAPRPTTGPASTDDTVYRPQVQGKIAANTSNGRAEDVLSIFRALGATSALYSAPAPATIVMQYTGNLALADAAFLALLVAATLQVTLIVQQNPAIGTAFRFDIGPGLDQGQLGRIL